MEGAERRDQSENHSQLMGRTSSTGVLPLWLVVIVSLAACGSDSRSLQWLIDFEPPLDTSRVTRLQAQILEGGCEGSVAIYDEWVLAGSAREPGKLAPGLYGFAASAYDDNCLGIAKGCREVRLPQDGVTVTTIVAEESNPVPACPQERCRFGICEEGEVDADVDVIDNDPDTDIDSDTDTHTVDTEEVAPLVIAQEAPAMPVSELIFSSDAVVISSGTAHYRQEDDRGGFVASTLAFDGRPRGRSITSRRSLEGNDLHVAVTAVAELRAGEVFVLSHERDENGYAFGSARWAWAALRADRVQAGGMAVEEDRAAVGVETLESSAVILAGWVSASALRTGGEVMLTLEVDESPCGVTVHGVQEDNEVPNIDASFFCIADLTIGTHVLAAMGGGDDFSIQQMTLSYVTIPKNDLIGAGTLLSESDVTIDVPQDATLVAFAWARFSGSDGLGDLGLYVNDSPCAQTRSIPAPFGLALGCVMPVSSGSAVLVASSQTEGPLTEEGITVRWLLLPAEGD